MEHQKNYPITDETRDTIIRLKESNWHTDEIAKLLNVSKSSVSYLVQIYNAVSNEDWESVHRLEYKQRTAVDWALRTLNKSLPPCMSDKPVNVEVVPVQESNKQDDILKALNDIGAILMLILEKVS